jgi:uncharacterized membrane protein
MDTMQRESPYPTPLAGSMYRVYLLSLAVCLAGNLFIRVAERNGWLPQWGRIALAVLTAIPMLAAAGLFWRMLKHDLDEMLQRIVLEGLAFALIVYVPLAGLYVNLRTAGAWTPRLDPPDILLTPALLVAIGVAFSWRRYR